MARKHAIWRGRIRSQGKIAATLKVRVERNLIALMPPAPPPLSISHLVDRDAVNPRSERRLTSEAMNGSKNTQEDFLRQIQGLVTVAEQMTRQPEHHAVVLGHEHRARILVTGGAPLHELGFTPSNLGPAGSAGLFHREFPSHSVAISKLYQGSMNDDRSDTNALARGVVCPNPCISCLFP